MSCMNLWTHSDINFLKEKLKLIRLPTTNYCFTFPDKIDYSLSYEVLIHINTVSGIVKNPDKLIKYFEPFNVFGITIKEKDIENNLYSLRIDFLNYDYPYAGKINP